MKMKSDLRLEIAQQLLESMIWLHNQDIVHCDVKPENIVLVESHESGYYKVKLCDFDSATRIGDRFPFGIDERTGSEALKFSRLWVSPEVYLFNENYGRAGNDGDRGLPVTTAMDIFNVGLVLLCLLSVGDRVILPENDGERHKYLTDQSHLNRKISFLPECYHESLTSLCCLSSSSEAHWQLLLVMFQSLSATAARAALLREKKLNESQKQTIISLIDRLGSGVSVSVSDLEGS